MLKVGCSGFYLFDFNFRSTPVPAQLGFSVVVFDTIQGFFLLTKINFQGFIKVKVPYWLQVFPIHFELVYGFLELDERCS